MTYPLPSINALAFEAKTKLIEALGDAPKEIKSANFDKLNCSGSLVEKTIFKIYSEILESILTSGKLEEDTEKSLVEVITKLKKSFKS